MSLLRVRTQPLSIDLMNSSLLEIFPCLASFPVVELYCPHSFHVCWWHWAVNRVSKGYAIYDQSIKAGQWQSSSYLLSQTYVQAFTACGLTRLHMYSCPALNFNFLKTFLNLLAFHLPTASPALPWDLFRYRRVWLLDALILVTLPSLHQ
jgi:hypothetical protein